MSSDIYKHHKQQGQVDCGGVYVIFSGCCVQYSISVWLLQEWEVMQERKGWTFTGMGAFTSCAKAAELEGNECEKADDWTLPKLVENAHINFLVAAEWINKRISSSQPSHRQQ